MGADGARRGRGGGRRPRAALGASEGNLRSS
jgi:hypothetical protein